MKIYTAHNISAREYINKEIVPALTSLGHTVNARWLSGIHEGDKLGHLSPERKLLERRKFAEEDYSDIYNCDAIIHFADPYGERAGRGKYIEFGFAYALNKTLYVVGENCEESVFYFTPTVIRCKTVEELWRVLKSK